MQKYIHKQLALMMLLFLLETIVGGVLFFLIDNERLAPYILDIMSLTIFIIIFLIESTILII